MDIPACSDVRGHLWAERIAARGPYVRYCVRRPCGLVVEGPWDAPSDVGRGRVRRSGPQFPVVFDTAPAALAAAGSSANRANKLRRLLERDGEGCFYCKRDIQVGGEGQQAAPNTATIDHYVALAKGGSTAFENLRAACYQCNHLKGDLTAEEFETVRLWGRKEAQRLLAEPS